MGKANKCLLNIRRMELDRLAPFPLQTFECTHMISKLKVCCIEKGYRTRPDTLTLHFKLAVDDGLF